MDMQELRQVRTGKRYHLIGLDEHYKGWSCTSCGVASGIEVREYLDIQTNDVISIRVRLGCRCDPEFDPYKNR